jgi:hypothetical protein
VFIMAMGFAAGFTTHVQPREERAMKKVNLLWGMGALVALGLIAGLLVSQASWATPSGSGGGIRKRIGFDPTNFGEPGDQMSDMLSDRPGHDKQQDRTPDNHPDAVVDGTPDCYGNISGGGTDSPRGALSNPCDAIRDIDTGDATPENQFGDDGFGSTFADGTSVFDGVPDATRYPRIDRALDYGTDYTPDWIHSDTYLGRIGGVTSVGDGDGAGLASDGGRGSGRGVHDTDARPHDGFNDRISVAGDARDVNRPSYGSGPGDKKNDESPDGGGLATILSGGGGSSGGCSLVASASASTGSGLAYLLVLLTPAALVVVRRKLRRK